MNENLDHQFARAATRVLLIAGAIIAVIWALVVLTAPKASDYTKEKALEQAKPALQKFAKTEGLPISKFEGPVFIARYGLDFTTYDVCYKNFKKILCFDDWTNRSLVWNIGPEMDEGYRKEFERAFHQKLVVK